MELVDNSDDFAKYYNHTWISEKSREGAIPWYVVGNAGDGKFALRSTRGIPPIALTFPQIAERFDLFTPPLGMINHDTGVMYLELIPFRQWKKGLTADRLTIVHYGYKAEQPLADIIMDIYNPKYYSFLEARDAVLNKKRSASAISPYWCIERINRAQIILRYKTHFAGIVEKNKVSLFPAFKDYGQMLEPYLPDKYEVNICPNTDMGWKLK